MNDTTERVRAACEHLLADGRDVTFTAVAQTSGISRATCYRDRGLRAVIDTFCSRHGELLTLTALANRIDNLTQTLAAIATKVRGQEELRALKRVEGPPMMSVSTGPGARSWCASHRLRRRLDANQAPSSPR